MKERIIAFVRQLPQELQRLTHLYPVEIGLIVLHFIGWVCFYASGWSEREIAPRLLLMPLFIFLALALNNLTTDSPWRKIYWACWTPLVPLLMLSGVMDWAEDGRLAVALGVLSPLVLMMCRRARDNDRFVADALIWLRSAFVAGVFVNVALGLFVVIVASVLYIFSMSFHWADDIYIYTTIFAETLFLPILFIALANRWLGMESRGKHVVEVLLNWIVTPALLIYTAILYLYVTKIVFEWSLPQGGVAYMVFAFMIAAIVVKGLQSVLVLRIYDWFFDRFSIVGLPLVILFWVGVVERVSEYGLTEPRVWLVVCGALMTLTVLLFLSRCTGRYLWVATAVFITFGALIFAPPLYPARIASWWQVEHKMPVETKHKKGFYTFIVPSHPMQIPIDKGYKILYAAPSRDSSITPSYNLDNDTLRLRLGKGLPDVMIPAQSILDRCRLLTGTATPTEQELSFVADEMMIYDQGEYVVLFDRMSLNWNDGALQLDGASVTTILAR